jgi:hypothetical protein
MKPPLFDFASTRAALSTGGHAKQIQFKQHWRRLWPLLVIVTVCAGCRGKKEAEAPPMHIRGL